MIKPSVSSDAGSEVRFQAYISALSEVIGHADRIDPLRRYCTGLLLPGERKSIEPMAARLDPRHVQTTHQSLHHFVAKAPWDDAAVLTAVREQVLPALTRHGPITAWILDDTEWAFPRKEPTRSAWRANTVANWANRITARSPCRCPWPMTGAACRLPSIFTCRRSGPPIRFAAPRRGSRRPWLFGKPQIALEQIRRALAEGLPPGVVLGDAAYGIETDFRTALTALSLSYVLGVQSTLGVWPPGSVPCRPSRARGAGPSSSAGMPSISRSAPRTSLSPCRRVPGRR